MCGVYICVHMFIFLRKGVSVFTCADFCWNKPVQLTLVVLKLS